MLRKDKGAISIFLIIITLSSVIFGGLFIDATRILVADRKVQNALNSAARSALSYYDENLVAQYGLYGVSQAQAESQFEKYFANNLTVAQNDNLNLIKFDVNNPASNTYAEVTVQQPLIAQSVFKQQVLDYMKYKGPVTITEGVISKFRRAFSPTRGNVVKSSEGVTKSFDTFKKSVNNLKKDIIDNLKKNLGKNLADKAKKTILDARKTSIEDYFSLMRDVASELDKADNAIKATEEQIIAFENECNDINNNAKEALESENITIENEYGNEDTKLKIAKQEIQIIQQNIMDAKKRLADIKSQLDNLLPDYYRLKSLENQLKADIAAEAAREFPNYDRIEVLVEKLQQVQEEKQQMEGKIEPLLEQLSSITISDLTRVEVDLSEHTSQNEDERKDWEKKQDNLQTTLEKEKIFKNIGPYEISATVRQNAEANLTAESFNSESKVDSNSSDVFALFNSISRTLLKPASDLRDNIYMTEYIMDKCTYLTSQTNRNHFFKVGEVEYILFGNDSEWVNITACLASISAIRMAINTVDYFIRNPIPEPLSRLAYALTRGALRTIEDMAKMIFTVGEGSAEISICPSLDNIKGIPKVSYSDHLRLALILKTDSKINGLQNTMQATMKTLKPNATDITTLNTQVCATARVKINLLFLPMLGIEKMNFANFEDGQYVIEKTVSLGY